jgi:hypothetical protein
MDFKAPDPPCSSPSPLPVLGLRGWSPPPSRWRSPPGWRRCLGGNAADAAVATGCPQRDGADFTGIGGDCFALWSAATTDHALNGPGAPRRPDPGAPGPEGFGQEPPSSTPTPSPGACPPGATWPNATGGSPWIKAGPRRAPGREEWPVAPVTAYFWSRGAERQPRHTFGGRRPSTGAPHARARSPTTLLWGVLSAGGRRAVRTPPTRASSPPQLLLWSRKRAAA